MTDTLSHTDSMTDREPRQRPTTTAERNHLSEAAEFARLERAEALISLHAGVIGAEDLMSLVAHDTEGKRLKPMKLSEVLDSIGTVRYRRDTALDRMKEHFDVSGQPKALTVGWLVNQRSNGGRVHAFFQAAAPHRLGGGRTIWTDTIE